MLVDDHYLVRLGLTSVIALEADMCVCAEAATGHHAIELFRTHQPDVTLMDLRLPDLSGTEAIRAIRAEFSKARIIALSTFAGDEEIVPGARGRGAGLPGEDSPPGRTRGRHPHGCGGTASHSTGPGGPAGVSLSTLSSLAARAGESSN